MNQAPRTVGPVLVFVAAIAITTVAARMQAPAPPGWPAFEVASVKANRSAESAVRLGPQPGGGLTAVNVPVRLLILYAYDLPDSQLAGEPAWISGDRFDVTAAANGDVPADELPRMLRALLADRFKLQVHTETRQLPIYVLGMAHGNGPGPQLAPTAGDCAATRTCGVQMGGAGAVRTIKGGGAAMARLVAALASATNGIVLDRTGLSGDFDFTLEWTPDSHVPAGTAATAAQSPPDAPSLDTALQEQLGLTLESTRGPMQVLVIDHIERPAGE